jgi:hypothetical protein
MEPTKRFGNRKSCGEWRACSRWSSSWSSGWRRRANIRLLSIGTGTNLSYLKVKNLDWGLAQWAKPLVSLLLDASMGISDFQCRHILKDGYRRIAPVFPHETNIKLDEWKRAQELIDFGTGSPLTDSWNADDVPQWLSRTGW